LFFHSQKACLGSGSVPGPLSGSGSAFFFKTLDPDPHEMDGDLKPLEVERNRYRKLKGSVLINRNHMDRRNKHRHD